MHKINTWKYWAENKTKSGGRRSAHSSILDLFWKNLSFVGRQCSARRPRIPAGLFLVQKASECLRGRQGRERPSPQLWSRSFVYVNKIGARVVHLYGLPSYIFNNYVIMMTFTPVSLLLVGMQNKG